MAAGVEKEECLHTKKGRVLRPLVRPQGPRRMSRITPMGCCQWQRGLKREGVSTKKRPHIATVSKAARPATDVAYNPSGVLPMAAGVEKEECLHNKKRPRMRPFFIVEMGGLEPPSKRTTAELSTCLACS